MEPNPYHGFSVGIQSWSFREFSAEQALKFTAGLGLHYMEVNFKHLRIRSTAEQIAAFRRLCTEYKITPAAFGVEKFTRDLSASQRLFEFGKALGIRAFSANPEPDSLDVLDKLVEQYQIAIGIHPHGPEGPGGRSLHRWYSAEVIMAAVKDHHPLIGSCLDTGHLIRAAMLGKHLDPVEQIHIMGQRNFGIHLKDNDNQHDVNVVLGKGVLDVAGVLKALRDVQFKGMISIEYEAHKEDPVPDIRACLDVLKTAIKMADNRQSSTTMHRRI